MASYTNDDTESGTSTPATAATDDGTAPTESDSLLNNDNDGGETGGRRSSRNNHHRRNSTALSIAMDTISEGMELFVETAADVKDAIVEEAREVKEAFVEDVKQKDDGDSIIFEMGLTRNLSILPSDLEDAWEQMGVGGGGQATDETTILDEVKHDFNFCPKIVTNWCCPAIPSSTAPTTPEGSTTDDEEGQSLLEKKEGEKEETEEVIEATAGKVPLHAYVTLLGAVISLSSIGPALASQSDVDDTAIKIYWRMTGTYMVLFPLALRSVMFMGLPRLTITQCVTLFLSSACYALMCLCFVLALQFTSVGNAVIFSNSQAILLLFGKVLVGQAVTLMEGSGAFVAFGGGILCAVSTTTQTTGDDMADTVWAGWGDLLALLAAVGGVGYLTFAKTVRASVPSVFAFMFMIMFFGSCCVLVFMGVSGVHFTFDRNINHGLWGWMNLEWDRLPLEIYMAVICNLMGAMGYVRCMAYFDNLVISVATLMEPVAASLLAYALNVGLLPNAMGWLGNFLVMAGTVAVIYPNSQTKEAS